MKKSTKTILLVIISTFIVESTNDHTVDDSIYKADLSRTISEIIQKVENKKHEIIDDEKTSYDNIHSATWYNLHGHYTASGEMFHKDSLIAAYNNADFGTYLKVTNIENNQSVIVKVVDRMGNKSANRIDLSLCAFDSISKPSSGRLKVRVEEVKK